MQNLRAQCETLVFRAVDAILPPRCVVTGEMVQRQGMISPKAWAELDFISAPYCAVCGFPFAFETEPESRCAACLENRPPFATARAPLKYNDTSRSMILGFKHADKTHVVKAFVPWLKQAGSPMLSAADFLIPVPLHHWRLIRRRYNQAALIADELSKATGVPALPEAMRRIRATPSQGYLSAAERFKNVRRAFALRSGYEERIKNRRLILVDDVFTTGATVKECTKVLLQAGALQVDVLTLARVAREGLD